MPMRRRSFTREGSLMVHYPSSIDELTCTLKRSCRLYGAAHKPPRIIPATAVSTASSSAATPSGGKRSFADILKSNTLSAAPSSRVAYAQDASLSVAEQLLAKIEQLQSVSSAAAQSIDDEDDSIEAALDSINYASPPLRPTVPLTRESARLYDEHTSWTLGVDEPSCSRKRSKRTASPTTLLLSKSDAQLKLASKKGKSKPVARMEAKEMARAREEKQGL
jgi:hypothetical protein